MIPAPVEMETFFIVTKSRVWAFHISYKRSEIEQNYKLANIILSMLNGFFQTPR